LLMKIAHLFAGVTLANPHALWAMLAVAAILIWSLFGVDSPRKLIAPLMRAVVLALFVIALAGPEHVTRVQGTTRPAVIDASASVTPAMREWTAKLLREDLKLRPDDPAVVFASRPDSTTVAGATTMLTEKAGCETCASGATDLEAALERVAMNPTA